MIILDQMRDNSVNRTGLKLDTVSVFSILFLVVAVLELGGLSPKVDFTPRGFVDLVEKSQSVSNHPGYLSVKPAAEPVLASGHVDVAHSSLHLVNALKNHLLQLHSALKPTSPAHDLNAATVSASSAESSFASEAEPNPALYLGQNQGKATLSDHGPADSHSSSNEHPLLSHAMLSKNEQHPPSRGMVSIRSLLPLHSRARSSALRDLRTVTVAKSFAMNSSPKTDEASVASAAALASKAQRKPPSASFRSLAATKDADPVDEADDDHGHSGAAARGHAAGGGDDDSPLIPDKLTKELSHVIR